MWMGGPSDSNMNIKITIALHRQKYYVSKGTNSSRNIRLYFNKIIYYSYILVDLYFIYNDFGELNDNLYFQSLNTCESHKVNNSLLKPIKCIYSSSINIIFIWTTGANDP